MLIGELWRCWLQSGTNGNVASTHHLVKRGQEMSKCRRGTSEKRSQGVRRVCQIARASRRNWRQRQSRARRLKGKVNRGKKVKKESVNGRLEAVVSGPHYSRLPRRTPGHGDDGVLAFVSHRAPGCALQLRWKSDA